MSDRLPRRVVHLDTGREWRGGQAQIFLLVRGLQARGVENVLLAPEGPLLARARAQGWSVEAWRARGDWDVPAALQALAAIRRATPEVVHAHSARAHALGVPAARLAAAPVVVVSRRVAIPLRGGLAGLKYRMPVDRYLCVSRGVLEAMARGGVPRQRLALVPSGIEPTPPPTIDLRERLGLAADAPLLGTSAALTGEKRHRDLLAAVPRILERVPEAHLAWFGAGPLRRELETERDRMGLSARVHVLGFRDDARALMAQCTIAVLASDNEGIATALIEAQADGVPVVATAVGGVPEVVQDGLTGRLIPRRDPEALAVAVIELLGDAERRAAMRNAARESARTFHIDRTVERTLQAYLVSRASNA